MENKFEVGRRIKQAIKNRGLKQNYVAEILNVTEGTIVNYIKGRREISEENLKRIAELTGASVQFLLTGTDAMLNKEEERILGQLKEPQTVIYRANEKIVTKYQLTQQQLLEVIKLKETNPFLYSILESVMELNNKLADKLETMEKQKDKSMQEE